MKTKAVVIGLCTASLVGCATVVPNPLQPSDIVVRADADRRAAQAGVEPITGPLTLENAIARALKYNLERRARLIEEAIAMNQLDVSEYDMLPKLAASIGYRDRSEFATTRAIDSVTGAPSLANPFISSAREHTVYDLGLTWSVLDAGLSYSIAKQTADRVLIASERRRKAMHLLIQDVRTAFWRTASAQKLHKEVRQAIGMAEEALADARQAEAERLRSPLDSLRYQRQLLENLRLLEAIDQELATARIELAHLINAPMGAELSVAEPPEPIGRRILDLPVERMEAVAIVQNADLHEQHYNARIAVEETRKTMLRLFPNLSFNYTLKYDNDRFLVHNRWNEAGGLLSYNLLNILAAPAQRKLADAGVALADQRRVATQMAVLSQVHLARLQYASAYQQFLRADAIWNVDDKISRHVAAREQAQAQSKLDRVANNTTAILSLLRRYQALALMNAAASKLQATLGMEPRIGSVQEQSLASLTTDVGTALKQWDEGNLPDVAKPMLQLQPSMTSPGAKGK
jgi:outer membrane protein TolC